MRLIAQGQNEDGSLLATALKNGGHQHPENIPYMNVHGKFLYEWTLVNFTSDFINCLAEFELYTADRAMTEELWPVAVRVLHYLNRIPVLDLDQEITGDYITESGTVEGWHGSRADLAMRIHWAMQEGLALAESHGDQEIAQLCRSYLERHDHAAMREAFLDPDSGCICDPGEPDVCLPMQASAQAVLAGFAQSEDEAAAWLQNALDYPGAFLPKCGFAIYFWLRALFASQATDLALEQMRRYYGLMLRYEATSCWSVCDVELNDVPRPETHAMSHSHIWSAAPAELLPAWVLGVRPTSPGFATVSITPRLGSLSWAEGVVPTPHGDIAVGFERENRD